MGRGVFWGVSIEGCGSSSGCEGTGFGDSRRFEYLGGVGVQLWLWGWE